MNKTSATTCLLAVLVCMGWTGISKAAPGSNDSNSNGYVDLTDYIFFKTCFTLSGPGGHPGCEECCENFDADTDGDVDLADYAAFQRSRGHLPIPLMDTLGKPILTGSTEPYSPRQTCGNCHEHGTEAIENGEWFQQGRTDLAGNVDMGDDYDGDGKFWVKSAGRYGKWGQSFQLQLAAKDNSHPSQIDTTTFAWIRDCSGCHSGGGPGEFDRDGKQLYNQATGQFGYELLGKSPEEVALDGDYSVRNGSAGTVSLAPWNVTGTSEPDCLLCHRDDRPTVGGTDMVMGWRRSTLGAGKNLVDASGQPVPAFAAASTAGQGWFTPQSTAALSTSTTIADGLTHADRAFIEIPDQSKDGVADVPVLQIDYAVGVANGSLIQGSNDQILINPSSVARTTRDKACVSCHPLAVVAGEVWFDQRDIHYSKFNNLNDDDPSNDIPPERSTACTECHPTGLDHNAAKGNSFQLQYRNELDYVNFRSCRDCHLTELANGETNPLKHPDSPDVPGDVPIHQIGFEDGQNGPMRVMSCQACHIPYALANGLLFRDITVPGNIAWTSQYLSADPLDPTAADKSKWYPPLLWKEDSDGAQRLFPASVWIMIYFGDWNQNGTPDDPSDDVIAPIFTWRVAQVVGDSPLPGTTDDDGDGRIEIDRPEEILAYLEVLKGKDSNGMAVATNPVLVRGPRVWYVDPDDPTSVLHFEHAEKGIPMTSYPYIWGMDHNVLPASEAWGAGDEPESCNTCHRNDGLSPVFDRKIIVDPHGLDGKPEYTTVKDMTKVYPFHSRIILRDVLGNPLTSTSTAPYSDRRTCGTANCHDVDEISNGFLHQQGRTDVDGNITMKDDFYEDGRWWVRGDGMYGRWSGGGGGLNRQTAGKTNLDESEMDMTAFYWAYNCGACHPGGGGVEIDRDGMPMWDESTQQFGYEALGLSADDVLLDGDYAVLDDKTGVVSPAPWDVTGVADPECMHCHRTDRVWTDGADMMRSWRADTLSATDRLVDKDGASVPAFSAAGTAGQGWYSMLEPEMDPPRLQIDYTVGMANGSLRVTDDDRLYLSPASLTAPARDQVCWGCHLPGGFQGKRGTVWFDERDVHFKKFTNRSDDVVYNDLSDAESTACNECHPGDANHNFAKGDSPYAQFRNDQDWKDFRSCRECHLTNLPSGAPNPDKHPDAPDVPGNALVHLIGDEVDNGPFRTLSCQACHVKYPLEKAAIVTDRSLTGTAVQYMTDEFLSANPVDPTSPDKSRWYPDLAPKIDSDGVERLFPQKKEVAIFWADWDRNDTPYQFTDDTIRPIILWRVRQITNNEPLAIVTDDNGDGKLEVNRAEEIFAYMQALKGNDSYGRQVARNPVLVKGERIWFENDSPPGSISSLDIQAMGLRVFPFEVFGLDHNVLAATESWGYAEAAHDGCRDCHRPITHDSPVIDRMVLVDPFGLDGKPQYRTVREMTGLNPP